MANLKNYLQSARKGNKTVDVVELTVEEELKRTDLAQKLKKGEITIAEARGRGRCVPLHLLQVRDHIPHTLLSSFKNLL